MTPRGGLPRAPSRRFCRRRESSGWTSDLETEEHDKRRLRALAWLLSDGLDAGLADDVLIAPEEAVASSSPKDDS